jgi:signal transduction histidine kinase/DNA-binding response OmpR family regulator
MIGTQHLDGGMAGTLDFLAGGGELGAEMRRKDWASTLLGDARYWPQSLRTSLSICLNSRMPVLVWWGRDLLMLYNDAYRQIISGKHPAALGQPGRECWPEIWHVIGPMLDAVLSRGESTFSEDLMLPLERKGFPEECYFTFSYSPIRDEAGRVGGVFCSVVETTSQVLAVRRTRTLRRLAEIATVGRTEADALAMSMEAFADSVADVPWALYQELGDAGLEPAVSVGLEPPEVEALVPILAVCLERVRETRNAEDLPPIGGGIAGPRGWVLPIGKSGSGLSGLLVLGRSPMLAFDESYRTFFELVAAALASSLETARAFEEEKRRAESLAELDRAKTTFFNNISHEFRTPLTLLLGPLDELRGSSGLPEDAAGQLEVIRRNALRLQRLVNALLEFSRLEAGRANAVFRPTNLSRHTRDLAGSFRAAFERAGLELEVDAPDLRQPIYVDRDMWERIVLNLLSNALKFTFEGKVTVQQRLEGNEAMLTVSDTGTGIPQEEVPRLFERFHRVVGARARTQEGSGIGLALVSDLVRLHGGRIATRSRMGEGTEFEIRLPLGHRHLESGRVEHGESGTEVRQAEAYVEEAMRWLPDAPPAPPVEKKLAELPRIVLADDNADMREYLLRLLEGRFRVEAFRTGTDALAAVRRARPDLVLTDVMMPGLDGFGLVAAIRADPDLQETPVLMLSARAGEEAQSEGLEAGADDYLVKPFSARELLARIDAHLARRTLRRLERQHAQQVASVFENAPVAIAMLRGPELVYEFANPSYRALVGGSDVVGKPLLTALPELQGQGTFELLQGVFRAGKPFAHQALRVALRRSEGTGTEEVFLNVVYEPLKNDEGEVHSIAVVATDVTDLVRARQESEEASRAKDEFMAMLGHELRNPLSPMLTTLELMRLRAPDVLERERGILERQVQHLARLVDDLLDVSRVAQGKIELQREKVELSSVVAAAVEQVSPLLEERSHYLRISVPRNGLKVLADPARLAQVFFNLLHNAGKYTDPGGHITVVAHREESEVVLAVRDDGVGIAPELRPRVFETFFQARQDVDRAKGGLGLGLALVKSLSELHGGRVEVESPGVGKGSTFTVRLPAATEAVALDQSSPAGEDGLRRGSEGLRILVVDDNVDAAESIAEVLELLGNRVRVAHDGLEALRLARESVPDLALLDIGLPVIDGYELAQRLRSEHPSLRLVALSGYGQDSDRAAALRAGFSRHLVKPVSMQEIESVVTGADPVPALWEVRDGKEDPDAGGRFR